MTDNLIVQSFDRDLAGFHNNKRQMEAIRILKSGKIKFFLYGGALGGGKSYLVRWYCVRYLLEIFKRYGLKDVPVMLACEDYPSLKDRQISKISREFPPWMGKSYGDHGDYGRCFILSPEYTGGIICFRNLDDPSKYMSSEFALIAVDELTKNDYDTFTQLRMRNRWPGIPDIDCQFIGGTNPGGIGHGWVKALWIDKVFGPEWHPPETPIDYRKQFAFVKSKATDNPYLDVGYHAVLNTLPKNMRKAFRDGRWDIFIGQAFPDFEPAIHVIEPIPIPAYAQLYMTYDWGYGKPFSVGWWWVDMEGVIYRFAEWYGWDGTPDIGLRMTDEEQAKGIVSRETKMGIENKSIIRLCDPTCFNKKPDYQGGGQGPSTAEVFARFDVIMGKGDPSRKLKLRQFHQRLQTKDEEGNSVKPMMFIYNNCHQFIRTIPNIVGGKTDIEDIDTTGEDHCISGETIVDTDKGKFKIKDLVGTIGYVLTVGGNYTKYYDCKKFGIEDVVKVVFEDGRSIICTPDHKFLTNKNGWVEAINLLTDEECHVSIPLNPFYLEGSTCVSKSSTKQHRSLTDSDIGSADGIFREREVDYTEKYGNTITEKFQKEYIRTIRMITGLTTKLKTLNLKQLRDTCLSMLKNVTIDHGGRLDRLVLQSGMEAQTDWIGTESTISNTVKISFKKKLIKYVHIAENIIKGFHSPNIAQEDVKIERGINQHFQKGNVIIAEKHSEVQGNTVLGRVPLPLDGLKVKRVERNLDRHDVYCLNAEYTHTFCVNGGIAIHNCFDESAHICMARPMSFAMPPKIEDSITRRLNRLEKETTVDDYLNDADYPAFNQEPVYFDERPKDDGILIPTLN